MAKTVFLILLAISAACAPLAAPAHAERRVALVIGNASYAEAPLKNPVNDSRLIAQALRQQGFDVIERQNASKTQMEEAVIQFGEKLGQDTVGLLYYSGHGLQVNGKNYLVPVDAKITSEQSVPLRALDADTVLTQMVSARNRVNLVILDACRNNPFERRFRAVGGGLAQMEAPQGTIIAYATAPGKVASDGEGDNGLYTQEFLRIVAEPGLKVEEVFKKVRVRVAELSDGVQIPWEASSLTGDFYFIAPNELARVTADELHRAEAEAATAQEELARQKAEVIRLKEEAAQMRAAQGNPNERNGWSDGQPAVGISPKTLARTEGVASLMQTATGKQSVGAGQEILISGKSHEWKIEGKIVNGRMIEGELRCRDVLYDRWSPPAQFAAAVGKDGYIETITEEVGWVRKEMTRVRLRGVYPRLAVERTSPAINGGSGVTRCLDGSVELIPEGGGPHN